MDVFWLSLIAFGITLFNILPWILALVSKKAEGYTKLFWFLSSFFVSWLGYFVFYFLVVRSEYINKHTKPVVLRNENGVIIR